MICGSMGRQQIRIIFDAMGGDHAPQVPVEGAVMAARAYGCKVTLLGPIAQIEAELARHDTTGLGLTIVDAPELIEMEEHPAQAIRRKSKSPQAIGLRLLRDGEGDAFVSAGHSGATMAGALFILGRLPGVDRPALGSIFPTVFEPMLVLDVGATTDCKPEFLLQFAHMGSIYAECALGIQRPRVALLANGEEATKGDKLVQETHQLLLKSKLNFVGNAEPKDALVSNSCDVLVADGFVGNLFLKSCEAVVKFALDKAKREMKKNWIQRVIGGLGPITLFTLFPGKGKWRALLGGTLGSAVLLGSIFGPPLQRLKATTDYRSYGGAPLLGVKGAVIISHGKSDALALRNAIRQACDVVESNMVAKVAEAISSTNMAIHD
jgi:glycerol-3-phosphate acyltransferase PlsX